MSQICPRCGNDIYATSAEHRCSDFVMPYMCKTTSTDARDAEIAALTERLRIVEAERDEARSGVKRAAESYGALMSISESLRSQLSALRAELERKDAALKEALEFLPTEGEMRDEASLNEGRASRAGIVGAHVRAALQPKEPPCPTA